MKLPSLVGDIWDIGARWEEKGKQDKTSFLRRYRSLIGGKKEGKMKTSSLAGDIGAR